MSAAVPVSVQILDKDYMVSCPAGEEEALVESARRLNDRLRQVRDSGKVLGTERMAVVTALNIIHEYQQQHEAHRGYLSELERRIRSLEEKVGVALGRRAAGEGLD